MAVTQLVTTPDSGSTPNPTGSFTPTVNDLLVVVLVASASVSGASEVPTADANGITFVKGQQGTYNTAGNSVDIYVANQLVPASPAAMIVTWNPVDVATSTVIDVYAVTGMTLTGASAVRSGNLGTGAAGTTPGLNLSPLTGSVTVLACGNLSAPAGVTPPTGWTEVNDTSCTLPTAGLEVAYRLSGFTGPTITWASTSATAWGSVAVELDTSAGAPPAIPPIIVMAPRRP